MKKIVSFLLCFTMLFSVLASMTSCEKSGSGKKSEYKIVDEKGKKDENGQYILMGEYPQTLAKDTVTITGTQDERGYYLGEDGNYYAKVTVEKVGSENAHFKKGKEVEVGKTYYFKVEPILWRIISNKNGEMLVQSQTILNAMPYQVRTLYENDAYRVINADGTASETKANDFDASLIHQWLNQEFLENAFDEKQKALIKENISIFSLEDLTNPDYGFSRDLNEKDSKRVREISDYAIACGGSTTLHNGVDVLRGNYWTKTPYGENGYKLYDVIFNGSISFENEPLLSIIYDASEGVVPVMKVQKIQ